MEWLAGSWYLQCSAASVMTASSDPRNTFGLHVRLICLLPFRKKCVKVLADLLPNAEPFTPVDHAQSLLDLQNSRTLDTIWCNICQN